MKQNKRKKRFNVDLKCPECGCKEIRLTGESRPTDAYIEFEFQARGKHVIDPYINDIGRMNMELDYVNAECYECGHESDLEEFIKDMAMAGHCKRDNVNAIADHWTYEIERVLENG